MAKFDQVDPILGVCYSMFYLTPVNDAYAVESETDTGSAVFNAHTNERYSIIFPGYNVQEFLTNIDIISRLSQTTCVWVLDSCLPGKQYSLDHQLYRMIVTKEKDKPAEFKILKGKWAPSFVGAAPTAAWSL
jgi:hypothetical protein